MEANLQRRVQRYGWDAAAALYEDAWRDNLKPAHDLMFAMAEPRPGERVADIASGSGLLAVRAAEAVGETGSVAVTDISAGMIELVRETATRGPEHHRRQPLRRRDARTGNGRIRSHHVQAGSHVCAGAATRAR